MINTHRVHSENRIKYPIFEIDKCIGCKTCVDNCPQHAIYLVNKKATIDYTKCDGCMICVNVCPQKGIHT